MLAARMLIWLVLSALDPPSLTKVVSDVQPAVVRVEVLDANDKVLASGSGFFISADGDVVTNRTTLAQKVRAEARVDVLQALSGG